MDITKLKRNPNLIKENLIVSGSQVFAKQACSILIPYNYLNYRMASISDKISILAVAAVVIGGEYGVLNGCASITITPSTTRQVKIGGAEFLEFGFEQGSVVIPDTTIVKDSDLLYEMNKYFYSFGRIPWFLNYDDVGFLFAYHREYGGLNISPNNVPFEIVTSVICHDYADKFKYYRHGEMKQSPMVVPFNSVLYNSTNATAKLLGANLEEGITSALISPSTKSEPIENLLRK